MRVTLIGGGGFRTPLIYGELLRRRSRLPVTEVAVTDPDQQRAELMASVLRQMPTDGVPAPAVVVHADQESALTDADVVLVAARVGGAAGRVHDETVALAAGAIGQETTGAGGVAYGLRSVPAMVELARSIVRRAPDAWVVNFTNPVSMVTEAMAAELGDRVIGVCDSPLALCRRVARALRVDPADVWFDYVGLNHLGWLRRAVVDGRDRLPDLLADSVTLEQVEEGAIFGAAWCQALGMIPNEYLRYYYQRDSALRAMQAAPQTRGQFLAEQQGAFYAAAAAEPARAYAIWQAACQERDDTYMADARQEAGYHGHTADDSVGYSGVALDVVEALTTGVPSVHILNVRNQGAVTGLDEDAVVEVPCVVDGGGAHPCAVGEVPGHPLGLMTTVKGVERDTIAAARHGDRQAAWRALASHPLVPSVRVAAQLLDGYWPPVGGGA